MEESHLRIGLGYDAHRLFPGAPLVLGGVQIPSDRGFDTHTDGDVLAHAVVDAIAGALADGGVGTHFPDEDPGSADARSLDLLEDFAATVLSQGYVVMQIDAVVVVSKAVPLQQHVPAMEEQLGRALRLPRDRVSVKPRSNDGLGPEGRGDGVSVTVVALVRSSS